jgi:hypothetical protein
MPGALVFTLADATEALDRSPILPRRVTPLFQRCLILRSLCAAARSLRSVC